MQPSTSKCTVNREDLGTRLSCFGYELEKWRTFHSFQLGEKIASNMARTARRQLEGRHLLFGEYLRGCTTLNVHYRR